MNQQSNKKEPRQKPLYSLSSNLRFMLAKAWQMDKTLLFSMVGQIPVLVLLPLLAAFLSRYTVELVVDGASPQKLITYIGGFSASILLLHLLNNMLNSRVLWRSYRNRFSYTNLCSEKAMDTDYSNIEDPDIQTKIQKAFNSLSADSAGTQQLFRQMINIGSNMAGLITYSVFIIALSPWIVVLLCLMTILNYYLNKTTIHWSHNNKDNWVPIERKLNYVMYQSGSFEAAKDIRLYGMSGWFQNIFTQMLALRMRWYKEAARRGFRIDAAAAVMSLLRDGTAYGYLVYQVLHTAMSAADFVFYFALISMFSRWLLGLIQGYNDLQETSLNFCDVREFLDLPDHSNRGQGIKLPQEACELELQNVTFYYPKNERATVEGLNLTIRKGEKLAIVGLNGAGKTTLVKLICGLYRPAAGNIVLNGHAVDEYNRDQYLSLFSVVFQDIHLLPVSIAKNISLCEETKIDRTRLHQVLALSGLSDKMESLPEGDRTLLMRSIHDNAVDLSGGEMQKLALARALYKDGNIIILDEPTAALDPIAENEMYLKYNQLAAGRTSVFISHRLSSTRFCDRIIMLEDGAITEEGTHDELMRLKGKYAELFEMQSHYYKEEIAGGTAHG